MSNKNKHIELLIICCLIIFTLPFIIQLQITKKNTTNYKMGKVDTIEIKSIVRGKAIFKNEGCYNCHKIDKRICFGVNLKDLKKRRSKEFIYQFIRNEDSLLKVKNPDVIALKEEFNRANGQHNKKHLTNFQINDLLNFISTQ